MKPCVTFLALLLGLGLCSRALTNTPTTPVPTTPVPETKGSNKKQIEDLVKQLGAARFTEREKAQKELEAIGAPALDILRKVANDAEPEISRRAAEVVRRVEEKMTAENVLAPKKVKLSFKDTPVLDAVAELAKQSGYQVRVDGDKAALANRKITLETGEISFFEALDQLCDKAGLVEKIHVVASAPNPFQGQFPNLRIQPFPLQPGLIPGGLMPGGLLPVVPQPGVAPINPKQLQKLIEALQQAQKLQGGVKKKKKRTPPAGPKPQPNQISVEVEDVQFPTQQPRNGGDDIDRLIKELQEERIQMLKQLQRLQKLQLQQLRAQPFPLPGMQIQPGIQIRPGFQIQPFPLPGFGGPQQGNPQQFDLIEGKPAKLPTSYAGAARIRLLPPEKVNMKRQEGEVLLVFEVTPEPRLQIFRPQGSPSIARARDDQGQTLKVIEQDQPGNQGNPFNPQPGIVPFPNPFGNPMMTMPSQSQRIIPVRLKLGDKKAELLKELAGTISVEVQSAPQPVVTIDNVLQAKGLTVKGKNNESLTLNSIEKVGDNGYKVQMTLEGNAPNQAGGVGGIQIGGGPFNPGFAQAIPGTSGMPSLVDADGKAYQNGQVLNNNMQFRNGAWKRSLTVEYRANPGQGQPARLTLIEPRFTSIALPFSFKDVPLP